MRRQNITAVMEYTKKTILATSRLQKSYPKKGGGGQKQLSVTCNILKFCKKFVFMPTFFMMSYYILSDYIIIP